MARWLYLLANLSGRSGTRLAAAHCIDVGVLRRGSSIYAILAKISGRPGITINRLEQLSSGFASGDFAGLADAGLCGSSQRKQH